jgi:hypothetical protein
VRGDLQVFSGYGASLVAAGEVQLPVGNGDMSACGLEVQTPVPPLDDAGPNGDRRRILVGASMHRAAASSRPAHVLGLCPADPAVSLGREGRSGEQSRL